MSAPLNKAAEVERLAGHAFCDRSLLDLALTHASVPNTKHNNERLEFLGDRVLGLVASELLYRGFPAEKEGDLAKRLTALVRRAALAAVAEKICLGAYMRLSAGELKAGGVQKETILADAVEALIGAIYLDGGLEAARKFIHAHWETMLSSGEAPPEDAKTRLQEWAQAKGLPLPHYQVISRTGADHSPVFEVEVRVEGEGSAKACAPSKRSAEKAAAALLLEKIESA